MPPHLAIPAKRYARTRLEKIALEYIPGPCLSKSKLLDYFRTQTDRLELMQGALTISGKRSIGNDAILDCTNDDLPLLNLKDVPYPNLGSLYHC